MRCVLCVALFVVAVFASAGCDTSNGGPTALRCEIRMGELSADSPFSVDSAVPLTVRADNYSATFSVIAADHGQPRLMRVVLSAPNFARAQSEGGLPTESSPFSAYVSTPSGKVQLSCRAADATTTTAPEPNRVVIIVAPHDGDRVTQAWAETQLVNSRLCRDGSRLWWTANAYWSSRDDVFHARPGISEITGPPELVHKCSSAQA